MEYDRAAGERACSRIELGGGRHVALARYGDPDGLPVLALHGAPASHLMFAPADAPARRLGLSVLAPDREGYGETPADSAPTLASRAEALHRLADALGLERFAVLGISGGCPYACALAARMQGRIRALALVSPLGPVRDLAGRIDMAFGHRRFFLDLPRRPRLVRGLARLGAALVARYPHTTAGVFARLIGGADRRVLSTPEAHALIVTMTRDAFRGGIAGAASDLEVFGRPWGVDLAAITAPSVVWQGTEDVVVPVAVSLALAARIPGCRLIRVEGAGHFWVLERVEEVLRELRGLASG